MANMSLEKIKMPEQAPDVRNKNFKEVSLGYTEEMAIEEAQRCLNCKHKPCVSGCPVNVRIPEFIAEVAKGDFMAAYKVITSTNALPAVCGRVCPQESQCESKCVRGMKGEAVAIGRLERFVADWYMKNCDEMPEKPASNGKKVAVIGSGPSALACAGDLAKLGYAVTMFEAFHKAGGVLVYGIPEFRLPKAIVQKEIDKLTALGVKIMTNMVIGKVLSIDEESHKIALSIREALPKEERRPKSNKPFNKQPRRQSEASANPAQEYFCPQSSVNASSDFEDKMKEWMKQANDRQTSLNKRANKRSY